MLNKEIFLTESHKESSWTHVLRGAVLLAALVAVPGTAVCWNLIPRDLFHVEESGEKAESAFTNTTYDAEDLETLEQLRKKSFESISHYNPNSNSSPVSTSTNPNELGVIRRMGASPTDTTTENIIPSSFSAERSVWPTPQIQPAHPAPPIAAKKTIGPRNFSNLENRLKQLGAKYYRLEKWGTEGKLYRFSCYVSPSENDRYQKYFQAIDTDELQVMEQVIEEIQRWKETKN